VVRLEPRRAQPITLKTDIEALEEAGKAGKVEHSANAKLIEKGIYEGDAPRSKGAAQSLLDAEDNEARRRLR